MWYEMQEYMQKYHPDKDADGPGCNLFIVNGFPYSRQILKWLKKQIEGTERTEGTLFG